jgi:hypothetical protein
LHHWCPADDVIPEQKRALTIDMQYHAGVTYTTDVILISSYFSSNVWAVTNQSVITSHACWRYNICITNHQEQAGRTYAMEVPLSKAYFGAPSGVSSGVTSVLLGIQAARIFCPGAARSGFSSVPASGFAGPLLENEAVRGAVALKRRMPAGISATAPARMCKAEQMQCKGYSLV